jgi:SAM-dependent methyltransferase
MATETDPPVGAFSIPITEEQPLLEDDADPIPSIQVDTDAEAPDEESVTLSSHPAPADEIQSFEVLKTDPSMDLDDIRFSEPPEEIFLEDAEFVARQEVAKPHTEAPPESDVQSVGPPPPPIAPNPQPMAQPKPELGPWHEHFFGEDYLRTVRTPTPREVAVECDFIESAIRAPAGARMLDVGCGLGLQTVELAARGYQMQGVDISPTMVSRACDEAEDRGVNAVFDHGDMRALSFDKPFAALLCWGTTFGYFDEATNERVIQSFHQALAPGGILLLEVVNRDFIIGSQPNQVWFEVDGSVCMEETDFDYQSSRLRVKRRVASQDGQERDREYAIRLYALHEIRELLERNGFRVDEVSGREATPGVFFGAHSPKMIIRALRGPALFSDDEG